MAKLPEYMLMQECSVGNSGATKILPVGAFVHPIETRYLPRHITDSSYYLHTDHSLYVYCFTYYGIVLLARDIIRKIGD